MISLQALSGALLAPTLLFLMVRPAVASTVISEVLYDASGSDNGKAFVELFGDPGSPLDGLVVEGINGSDGSITHSVALSGSMPADGVFVIGDDDGSGATAVANADWIAEIDLQNGPDSVLLRMDATVLDAVGYGDFTGLFFAGEGAAAADVAGGSSLARSTPWLDTDDNATDFQSLALPTPGLVPVAPTAVPLPPSLWLMLSGGLVLAGRCRQRGPCMA